MGLGIIVATLIMTVSSVIHNNNLSNEFIIKEAQKLGMIMPEDDTEDGGLWGNTATENEDESESQNATENELASETEMETESEVVPEEVVYHTITITDTDAARHVGEKLYEKGLVEDAEDFRLYLKDQGYATRVRSGVFQIPEGATYEEICDIIVRRPAQTDGNTQ